MVGKVGKGYSGLQIAEYVTPQNPAVDIVRFGADRALGRSRHSHRQHSFLLVRLVLTPARPKGLHMGRLSTPPPIRRISFPFPTDVGCNII